MKERCLSFNLLTIEKEYFCHQHEAKTKIFYHANILDSRNDISAVAIDAEDTGVLVMSAYASHKLEKDVVLYRRNKLIKYKSFCSAEMAPVLIGFHALTGADAASGFYGHSKKTLHTKIQKNCEGKQMLLIIRKNANISQTDINNARKLVIKFMHSDKTSCNLAQARTKKWKQMKNKTTLQLPPDEDSFYCTRKTPTQKIASWMIPTGQFPPGKSPPRKMSTQDNSHPNNSHPESSHPDNFHLENPHPG